MARLPRNARMLAWQQNIKALIEAKEKAAPGASEDSAIERPAGAGIGDTSPHEDTAQVDETDQADDTAKEDDTARYEDTVQDDDMDGDTPPHDDTAQANDTAHTAHTADIGQVDTAHSAQVDDTAEDQATAPIVQVDLTAEDDDTADKKDTAPIVQVDLTPKTKKKKRKGKSGAARDAAKIRRLDAEGTPAAKAEAERIRRKRLHGGRTTERQRRVEKQQIGTFIGLRIEQHYMKIAELNAEAASSSQQ